MCSGFLRTAFNGWCTERRFQRTGTCRFGCHSMWQEDSIGHYAVCPYSVAFARNFLRFRPRNFHIGHFVALGLTEGNLAREEIETRALWCYAVYRAWVLLSYLNKQLEKESWGMPKPLLLSTRDGVRIQVGARCHDPLIFGHVRLSKFVSIFGIAFTACPLTGSSSYVLLFFSWKFAWWRPVASRTRQGTGCPRYSMSPFQVASRSILLIIPQSTRKLAFEVDP